MKRWIISLALTVLCCLIGGLSAGLIIEPETISTDPFLMGLAISALPSVIAGMLMAKFFLAAESVDGSAQDPLTGLYGKGRLLEDLEAEVSRCIRAKKLVGVIVAEIEQKGRFSVPDYVALHAMARTLKQSVRKTDQAYVLGKGQFAMLLSCTNSEGGEVVLNRLRNAVVKVPELNGVTLNFGPYVLDPSDIGDMPTDKILNVAIEKAHQAKISITVEVEMDARARRRTRTI